MEHQVKQPDKKGPSSGGGMFGNKEGGAPAFIQPKLKVNAPDDKCEKEADAMADKVTSMRQGGVQAPGFFQPEPASLQRKCAHCEEEEKQQVQRKETGEAPANDIVTPVAPILQRVTDNDAQEEEHEQEEEEEEMPTATLSEGPETEVSRKEAGGGFTTSDGVASRIQRTAGSGQSLQHDTRNRMEGAMGADFSQVKIHTDGEAVQLSRQLNAHAFTYGNDIYFNQGAYAPGSQQGDHLLAHELTHVVQQGGVQRKIQRQGNQKPKKEYVPFQAKVPENAATLEDMYKHFERIVFGKQVGLKWTCSGTNCDMANNRGKVVNFRIERSALGDYNAQQGGKKGTGGLGTSGGGEFKKLPQSKQQKVNKEADNRYYKATGDKEGSKIKPGEEGKAITWHNMRNEVMLDKAKLEALPPQLKELMGGEGTFDPADYEQLLRIGEKLKQFSQEDVAVFKMLSIRGTKDLKLFEQAVDIFLARKQELKEALEKQQSQPAPKKDEEPASMQEAIEGAWKGFDGSNIGTMSESDRYKLAAQQRNAVAKEQLKYMVTHPGETAGDFVKSATLQNTGETFKGVGQDWKEMTNPDANGWARWAAGAGAGAKISGWLLAVGAVVYALSWLTGIGELATIAAFMGYALASMIALSAAESDLRLKAASQATTEEEFKEQATKSGTAMANVIVAVALLAVAMAIGFLAKTFFPETVAKISSSVKSLRTRILKGINPMGLKGEFLAEVKAHRDVLLKEGEKATQKVQAAADAIEQMSIEEFINKLEKGDSGVLGEAAVDPSQKMPWREMSKTPEGMKAIKEYKANLEKALRKSTPQEIAAKVKEQLDAVDALLKDAEAATDGQSMLNALDKYDKFMSPEEVAKRGAEHEQQIRKEKAEEAIKLLEDMQKMKEELYKYNELKKYIDENPTIIKSFAEHPEALKVLQEVMKEVKDLGPDAVIKKYKGQKLQEATPLTPEQQFGAEWAKQFKDSGQKPTQPTNDLNKIYEAAGPATTELEGLANEIAKQSNGEAKMRPELKGRERAEQKVRDEYGGDASKLVDVSGGKIVFKTLKDLYNALRYIKEHYADKIVYLKDRFANPQGSGYRDILMNVKMSNGHVAELRLHLEQIDKVANFEHPLYEVKRVVAPEEMLKQGKVSPVDEAIALGIEAKSNAIFNEVVKVLKGE